jgi:hypothetical protein
MFLGSESFISEPYDVILEFLPRPLFRIPIQKPHSYRDDTDEGKGKNEKPTLTQAVLPSLTNTFVPKKVMVYYLIL